MSINPFIIYAITVALGLAAVIIIFLYLIFSEETEEI